MLTFRFKVLFALGMLTLACNVQAAPVSISVNPGSYSGSWSILGNTGNLSGPASVTLQTDATYNFVVGSSATGKFQFSIDSAGNVNSINPDAATGGNGQLSLNNASITVDPDAYGGSYWIEGYNPNSPGQQVFSLVTGLGYTLRVGNEGVGKFSFDVDANGSVSSNDPSAATGGPGLLTFNNVSISVNPNNFTGSYWILGLNPGPRSQANRNPGSNSGSRRWLFAKNWQQSQRSVSFQHRQ
ncbi:MAG: hypothetical protein ACI8P9_002227 [Parasphingorhabdus sp.]|jgi:hypothetical protein